MAGQKAGVRRRRGILPPDPAAAHQLDLVAERAGAEKFRLPAIETIDHGVRSARPLGLVE
jgi:hypothetical protein